jgi:dihydrofolate reductase
MRKLKLQIQTSIDLFIGDKTGRSNWMIWNWGPDWTWDDQLKKDFYKLKSSVDCVLLSRKMAEEGFIDHWARVASNKKNPQSKFAKKITDAQKVVFSKTITKSRWDNTIIAGGDLAREVNKLKKQKGKDIIVYGGASFVSSLIKAGLIDEFHFFVNPTALGGGIPIFDIGRKSDLKLVNAKPYDCGVVVLTYVAKF